MSDERKQVEKILFQISKGRNKRDFQKYITNTVIDCVFVSCVEWQDDGKIKVFVEYLPFNSVDLSDEAQEEYLKIISEANTADVRRLNTILWGKTMRMVKKKVVEEVERHYEIFNEVRGGNVFDLNEVIVEVERPDVFDGVKLYGF